jgi:hypothetical protein
MSTATVAVDPSLLAPGSLEEESQRKDDLLSQRGESLALLAERVPQLEAPRELREASQTAKKNEDGPIPSPQKQKKILERPPGGGASLGSKASNSTVDV